MRDSAPADEPASAEWQRDRAAVGDRREHFVAQALARKSPRRYTQAIVA
jgi:hypothetical protein